MSAVPNPPINYWKYSTKGWEYIDSHIIQESHVSLTVNGEVWLTWMCTPTDLEALAVGFLYNEGVINDIKEVEIVRPCENLTNIDVWLNHPVTKPIHWKRTSGCAGGQTSVKEISSEQPSQFASIIQPEKLLRCMDQLLDVQELYREVRGVHCSALSDGEKILVRAEDIGRHNTLDKVSGWVLLHKIQTTQKVILTTGRISSEMLQKSARLGAMVIVSRTSPSSLSIQSADKLGITLIGYARRNQFNVYTHPERLQAPCQVDLTSPPEVLPSI